MLMGKNENNSTQIQYYIPITKAYNISFLRKTSDICLEI